MKIRITRHAELRARERAGIKGRSLARLVSRILEKGISLENAQTTSLIFLLHRYASDQSARPVIYGHFVYIFRSEGTIERLITVIPVPLEYHRHIDTPSNGPYGDAA